MPARASSRGRHARRVSAKADRADQDAAGQTRADERSVARQRVFIPDPIHADGVARLAQRFVVDQPPVGDSDARHRGFAEADAVIVRNIAVDRAVLAAAPRLKVIAKHGAGVDNIDVAAATARGIVVANIPGGNADAVAEATVALMLATLRRVPEVHRLVVNGGYAARFTMQFGQLFGRTLGLVGIGNIGARVARICAAGFKMHILAYDPGLSAVTIAERGAEKVDHLASLLADADVVSLHLPLNERRRHLIGAAEITEMKRTAILVNAARGPLVGERALA
jgi:D-3-phosphoglycerate dehydrogenase